MSKKIAIIGLGWVGTPLALSLIDKGHQVLGTTTSMTKQNELSHVGITSEIFSISAGALSNTLTSIDNFDVMLIAITPGFNRGATDYPDNIKQLVALAELRNIKQVILLSSTGAYTGLTGTVNEGAELAQHITKVEQLNEAEQAVLGFSQCSQVLRLAGLVGPNRLPGKFLAGKKNLAEPHEKVHLIHLTDVLGIIQAFIGAAHQGGIYNCVSPTNSTRQCFYQQAAMAMGLEPPVFVKEAAPSEVKVINSQKLQDKMAYQFVEPDITQWLKRVLTQH